MLIGFDRQHRTTIGRGENSGRTLVESNIVRSIRRSAHGPAPRFTRTPAHRPAKNPPCAPDQVRHRRLWDARFDALDTVVEDLKQKEKVDGRK